MGSIPGVVLGAVVMVTMPELLRDFSDHRMLLLGVILVLPALFRPKGLWPAAPHRVAATADITRWQHRWFQLQRPWLQPPGRCCELPAYRSGSAASPRSLTSISRFIPVRLSA
jgi:hypothetical protein